MSFEKMKADELRKVALEEFAVEVGENDTVPEMAAALFEAGYKFKDYQKLHPEKFPEVLEEAKRETEPNRAGSVVSTKALDGVVEEPVVIKVKEEMVPAQNEKYLVKMTRPNISFDNNGYKFTKEHPYALVDGKDLKAVVEGEDGFRQATPSELEEFYG